MLYVDLGDFASHLVECIATGTTNEFGSVFNVVERLHIEGDPFVREAATIGLLEGLQNHAEHREIDEDQFTPWLGPQSLRWWRGLQKFWAGQSSVVQPAD